MQQPRKVFLQRSLMLVAVALCIQLGAFIVILSLLDAQSDMVNDLLHIGTHACTSV